MSVTLSTNLRIASTVLPPMVAKLITHSKTKCVSFSSFKSRYILCIDDCLFFNASLLVLLVLKINHRSLENKLKRRVNYSYVVCSVKVTLYLILWSMYKETLLPFLCCLLYYLFICMSIVILTPFYFGLIKQIFNSLRRSSPDSTPWQGYHNYLLT